MSERHAPPGAGRGISRSASGLLEGSIAFLRTPSERRARLLLFLAGLGGLVAFASLVAETHAFRPDEELAAADLSFAAWIATHTPGWLYKAGLATGELGHLPTYAVFTLVVCVIFWRERRRLQAVGIALGAILLEVLVASAKGYFGRERPGYGIASTAHDSFPSGHAAYAAFIATILLWFALSPTRSRLAARVILGVAISWAFAQAAGRLIIGAHYLSDVGAGAALGLGVAGLALAASSRPPSTAADDG